MSRASDLARLLGAGGTITTDDNTDTLTLTSTDADANAGPNLRMYRNSASPADVDLGGVITFDVRNDNSQDFEAASIKVYTEDASDGTEDSAITITCMNGGSANNAMQINPTETTFNESSVDRDFRIESDNNTHMLFVDASANGIGINTDTPTGGTNNNNAGFVELRGANGLNMQRYQDTVSYINRSGNDGDVVGIQQGGSTEGTISVSGSTVAYNGFSGLHESSGIATNTAIGTVVSTIDELDVYSSKAKGTNGIQDSPKAGQTRADHAKVKVSDTAGDKAVYGVVATFNEQGKVNVASVGIGSVRVTGACAKGDLLESNGDGTAKVQSDDIVRSKTIGKVTIGNSNSGVKLVSCVLYCG